MIYEIEGLVPKLNVSQVYATIHAQRALSSFKRDFIGYTPTESAISMNSGS